MLSSLNSQTYWQWSSFPKAMFKWTSEFKYVLHTLLIFAICVAVQIIVSIAVGRKQYPVIGHIKDLISSGCREINIWQCLQLIKPYSCSTIPSCWLDAGWCTFSESAAPLYRSSTNLVDRRHTLIRRTKLFVQELYQIYCIKRLDYNFGPLAISRLGILKEIETREYSTVQKPEVQ